MASLFIIWQQELRHSGEDQARSSDYDTSHYLSYHAKLIILYADNVLWVLRSQLCLDWLWNSPFVLFFNYVF